MANEFFIGTCGWDYPHWRQVFYPSGIRASDRLGWYAMHFNTVEVDATFYGLPSTSAIRRWYETVPAGFRFSFKAPRIITHYRKLVDVRDEVSNFYHLSSLLGEKRGAHLFQLSPSFSPDVETTRILARFLELLDPGAQNVVEFRHGGWWNETCIALLQRFGVAFCGVDGFGMPEAFPVTADFAYCRFHATGYDGNYTDEVLTHVAEKLQGIDRRKVYAYFNNDTGACAVSNALTLRIMLQSRT